MTQSVTVPVFKSSSAGGSKFFTVNLTDATGSSQLGANSSAVVTVNHPLATNATPSNLGATASVFTHTTEAYGNVVKQLYLTFLQRPADSQGLTFWTASLAHGLTDEQLQAKFLGSSEYIQNHGGTLVAWIQGLYEQLFGRVATTSELTYWYGQVSAGVTPTAIALSFTTSAEAYTVRISADYEIYLGRAVDAPSLATWLAQFEKGTLTDEDLAAILAGSTEYYNSAAKGQQNKSQWVDAAFEDILGRAASSNDTIFWSNVLN